MKLSWRETKSYVGWAKYIGKNAGTGQPRCFYLGRDKAVAELTAAKLNLAYRRLLEAGHTGWTDESVHAVLTGPTLPFDLQPQAAGVPVRARVSPGGGDGLRFHAALDDYLQYETQRAPGQISWGHLYGIRCRVKAIKQHIKDRPLAEIGYDQLAQFVSYFASRPLSKYWGRKIGVVTAHDTIKELRTIFDWFDLSGRWDGPKRFDRAFKVRPKSVG